MDFISAKLFLEDEIYELLILVFEFMGVLRRHL